MRPNCMRIISCCIKDPTCTAPPRFRVHRQCSAQPGQPWRGQPPGRGRAKSFAVLPGVGGISRTFLSSLSQRACREKGFQKSAVRGPVAWLCSCRCLLQALLGFSHIVLLKARPGGYGFQNLKVPRHGCTVSGLNAKPRFRVCGFTSKLYSDHIWPLQEKFVVSCIQINKVLDYRVVVLPFFLRYCHGNGSFS